MGRKPLNCYLHPRDEILATMTRIYRYRMATTSGGKMSLMEPDGTIWITPARFDKDALTRQDIARVRPDGVIKDTHPPHTEDRSTAEVWLMGHGQTEWSISGQLSGRVDLLLTKQGEREACDLAAALHGIQFDTVLYSPLRRAVRTCELAGHLSTAFLDPNVME